MRPSWPLLGEHRHGGVGDVVAEHRGHPSVPGRASDHALCRHHPGHEVHVHVHPQEGEGHAALAHRLLGGPVMADEREGRVGTGAHEGQVDDPPGPGGGRGVHGGQVLLDPVLGLSRRDQEDRVGAVQGRPHLVGRAVGGRAPDLGAGDVGRARRVTDHQALHHAVLGQPPGHPAAHLAGRAGHGDHRAWRPLSARPSVISSAYSRSEPTGRPLASRVTATSGARSRSESAR